MGKSKKVVVIEGSPRKGGNTDILSDEFIKGALDAGYEVDKIYLHDKKLNFCHECYVCRKNNGDCFQKDDINEIINKIIESDVYVLATPVFFYTFSAQLKTLIDRTFAKEAQIKDKKAYLITTGATPEEKYMQVLIDTFRSFNSCMKNIEEGGIVIGCGAGQQKERRK